MASEPKSLMSLQEQYPASRFNLLLPTTQAGDVSNWHRMSVSLLTIDPDARKGDVYQAASRAKEDDQGNPVKAGNKTVYEDLFALARPAVDRIGMAAGIAYDAERSKPLSMTADYVVYETIGGIRRPDGSWVAFKSTKEVDLRAIEMELREAATKRLALGVWGKEAEAARTMYRGKDGPDPSNPNWKRFFIDPADMGRAIDDLVRPQMIQWRKNKLMRAETGARLRVIRGLLGIRMQYTREELALPFVVPRIDFAPDYSDPDVKKILLAQAGTAMQSLYGGHSASVNIPRNADVIELEEHDDEGSGATTFRPASPDAPAEEPARESAPVAQPAPGMGGPLEPGPNDCQKCGATNLESAVIDFSKRHYGQVLCRACQREANRNA